MVHSGISWQIIWLKLPQKLQNSPLTLRILNSKSNQVLKSFPKCALVSLVQVNVRVFEVSTTSSDLLLACHQVTSVDRPGGQSDHPYINSVTSPPWKHCCEWPAVAIASLLNSSTFFVPSRLSQNQVTRMTWPGQCNNPNISSWPFANGFIK